MLFKKALTVKRWSLIDSGLLEISWRTCRRTLTMTSTYLVTNNY